MHRAMKTQMIKTIGRRVVVNAVFIMLPTGLVSMYSNLVFAQSADPNRCIDQVSVWVDDRTDTFFAPFIVNQLRAKLTEIESMEELELSRTQRERKVRYTSPRRDDENDISEGETEIKRIRIRTAWKGGLKDLIFISKTEKAKPSVGDLKLQFHITDARQPKLSVIGSSCNYESRSGSTIVSSYPEKIEGRNQNYKNLATFLAYNLIKLSEMEGCNLGSETQPVIAELTQGDRPLPIPMGVEVLSQEASAKESERYERVIRPDQYPSFASKGQIKTVFFNRPTDLIYRTVHPFKDLEWKYVMEWQVNDDDICDVFDKSQPKSSKRVFRFDMPETALDDAVIKFKADSGAKYFRENPNLSLEVSWFSDRAMTQLVSKSATISINSKDDREEIIFSVPGVPEKILPGKYMVQLSWKKDPNMPKAETISFPWNSTEEYNVSDHRGLFGPKLVKLLRSRTRSATRVMQNYFFQQAITNRFLRWESWSATDANRFAKAILWHFQATGELPYLSQWSEAEGGVVSELVRALNVASRRDGGLDSSEAQHALEAVGRFERPPESFNKRYMRKAMCSLSSALEQQSEPIPALWMRCDG